MILLKIGVNKDGREWRQFRTGTGNKVRFWAPAGAAVRPMTGAQSFSRTQSIIGTQSRQMYGLGQIGVNLIKARVSQGIGSNDTPMPPLKQARKSRWSKPQQQWVNYGRNTGYLGQKTRAGGQPIRDLTLTGNMLNNLQVRSVSDSQVRIDITSSKERIKARANEVRAPWFGWSRNDLRKLIDAARGIWGEVMSGFGVQVAGGPSRPIWMQPWQTIAPHSRNARWAATTLRSRILSGNTRR